MGWLADCVDLAMSQGGLPGRKVKDHVNLVDVTTPEPGVMWESGIAVDYNGDECADQILSHGKFGGKSVPVASVLSINL